MVISPSIYQYLSLHKSVWQNISFHRSINAVPETTDSILHTPEMATGAKKENNYLDHLDLGSSTGMRTAHALFSPLKFSTIHVLSCCQPFKAHRKKQNTTISFKLQLKLN